MGFGVGGKKVCRFWVLGPLGDDGVRRRARGGGRGWPARTGVEYYLSLGVGLGVSLV